MSYAPFILPLAEDAFVRRQVEQLFCGCGPRTNVESCSRGWGIATKRARTD